MPTANFVAVGLALVFALPAGCDIPEEDTTSAFDDEDNDDTLVLDGKADGVTPNIYRSGCGTPIRTGSYALLGTVVTPTGVLTTGYVVVTDEDISAIAKTKAAVPVGVPIANTVA